MMLRGSACDVLDATELASMSAAEFNNCPSLIGMLPGCSAQHWTNLAVVAKEASITLFVYLSIGWLID